MRSETATDRSAVGRTSVLIRRGMPRRKSNTDTEDQSSVFSSGTPALCLFLIRYKSLAYDRFRRESSGYHHTIGNYLLLMDWIDERRIEMLAEGWRYWVPTDWDFWAMRDCWDDLAKE